MKLQTSGLIVCGTDTDVGKTVVSALLVQGLNAIYWKPVQSGLEKGGDTGYIRNLLNLPRERWLDEAYKFQAPVSPHWAAEKESKKIDPEKLKIPLKKNARSLNVGMSVAITLSEALRQNANL